MARPIKKKKPKPAKRQRKWVRKRERCEFCGRRFYGYVITGPRTEGKEACSDCYHAMGEPAPPRPDQGELHL